jgi:hypothetical protein
MTMPKFTGEAALYQTSGQYRTPRHSYATHLVVRTTDTILPARDEVIEVHGCAPGSYVVEHSDGTWECWSNPDPWWGGEGGGGSQGAGGEPGGEKPPPGGGGAPPKDKPNKPPIKKHFIESSEPPKKGFNPKEGRTCYGLKLEIAAGGDPIIWDDPFKGKYTSSADGGWNCRPKSGDDLKCNVKHVWNNGDIDKQYCYNKKPPYPPV